VLCKAIISLSYQLIDIYRQTLIKAFSLSISSHDISSNPFKVLIYIVFDCFAVIGMNDAELGENYPLFILIRIMDSPDRQ